MASTSTTVPPFMAPRDRLQPANYTNPFLPQPRNPTNALPHRLAGPNGQRELVSEALRLQSFRTKPRVFILSDIGNEPDDAESLCRYLLYANQFETEGLVACTSTWLRNGVHPEHMESIVEAYGDVVDNLNAHVHPEWQYPSKESLEGVIRKGAEVRQLEQQGAVPG
jgi:hypothetical protein